MEIQVSIINIQNTLCHMRDEVSIIKIKRHVAIGGERAF